MPISSNSVRFFSYRHQSCVILYYILTQSFILTGFNYFGIYVYAFGLTFVSNSKRKTVKVWKRNEIEIMRRTRNCPWILHLFIYLLYHRRNISLCRTISICFRNFRNCLTSLNWDYWHCTIKETILAWDQSAPTLFQITYLIICDFCNKLHT